MQFVHKYTILSSKQNQIPILSYASNVCTGWWCAAARSRAKRSHRPAASRMAAIKHIVRNPNIIFNNSFIYQLFENLKTVLAMVRGDDKMVKIS